MGRKCFSLGIVSILLVLAFSSRSEAQNADDLWMVPYIKSMLVEGRDLQCLGWGRHGQCALIQQQSAGLRGGFSLRFILLDTKQNLNLFDKQVFTDELAEHVIDPTEVGLPMCLTQTGEDFMKECEEAGIDKTGGPALEQFPLDSGRLRYNILMNANPSDKAPAGAESEEALKGAKVLDLELVANCPGKGSKTLLKLDGVTASSYQVEGYFKNPYEPWILVVYSFSAPGFEGEPNTTNGFVGCSLEDGFE